MAAKKILFNEAARQALEAGANAVANAVKVTLGPAGRNFAAGMSGGIAYVWDSDGQFRKRCNMKMVEIFPIETDRDQKELKALIERHVKYTQSAVGQGVLDRWSGVLKEFVKVYPTDYRRVIEEGIVKDEGLDGGESGFSEI